MITRRKILVGGLKATVGLVALDKFGIDSRSVIASSFEQEAQPDRFQPAFKRLDEFVARHMHELGLPGMTLALANRDGLLRVSHYGFADVKSAVRVGPQTLFEIGSISKSFVAIAVLRAVEDGKIDLHKPVIDYLPWVKFESKYAPITTHHLLSHTAGLSAVPLLMRVAADTLRTGSEPGAKFVYSNIGYVLLGFLLEAVEKQPLATVLRKRVLEPLGMNESEPVIVNAIRERLAIGYGPPYDDRPASVNGKLVEAPWLEVSEGAGSVASTPGDMVAYLRMLLNRGVGPRGRVLTEKSFQLLIRPAIKAPFRGEDASYGYGLWVGNSNGHTLLRHTGGMVAFSSAMYADLTGGFAAFASVNARRGSYRPVSVVGYALALLNAAAKAETLPPLPPPFPSPEVIKNAADFAGTFTSPDGKKLVLTAKGEQLLLEHNGRNTVLEQAGPDRFIVKHPELDLFALTFGRENGVIVEAFHGTGWWTNSRYAGPKSFEYPEEWDAYVGRYRSDSPWYGGARVFVRKGRLTLDGEPLTQISPGVFRPDGDSNTPERISFDTMLNGKAVRMNFSGIDYFRQFTP
ncbi:MAG TPA: serine hydrolase, partial [Pyrinomonadaceae bacterium]|nr:serine hydrolase [Pyrinomonadaceae bacterium]